MTRIAVLALAACVAGCSMTSSIVRNGESSTKSISPSTDADEVVDAGANNDFNAMSIVYLVGTVGLLVAAIAISQSNDGNPCHDPLCR